MSEPDNTDALMRLNAKMAETYPDWLPETWAHPFDEGRDPYNCYGRYVPARPLLLSILGVPKGWRD